MATAQPTAYADINALLARLLDGLQRALSDDLLGLYLFGSLVNGDFDYDISDIDLLAVTAHDVDELVFARLQAVHADVVAHHPGWEGRIEIAYLSAQALKTYKTEMSQIAIMSPGEPFHFKEAGRDWLLNWWMVRERGHVLYGPPVTTWIDPITPDEFRAVVRDHTAWWTEEIDHIDHRPGQAYAILTLCRALYALDQGEQPSKRRAAEWAMARYPQWADLIGRALVWREQYRDQSVDHAATLGETKCFVHWVVQQVQR
jgi:hypothetical protein